MLTVVPPAVGPAPGVMDVIVGGATGVMAMPIGNGPTLIGVPAVWPSVIGVTEPDPPLVTYTVDPLGVTATCSGSTPTVMGFSAVRVAVSMGVTVPDPAFAT